MNNSNIFMNEVLTRVITKKWLSKKYRQPFKLLPLERIYLKVISLLLTRIGPL